MNTTATHLSSTSSIRNTRTASGFLPTKLLGGGAGAILAVLLVQATGGFLSHTSAHAASCVQAVSSYSQTSTGCDTQKNAGATTVTATAWGQSSYAAANPAVH